MNMPINYQAGTKGVVHAAAVNGQDNNGNTLCRPGGQRPGTILFEVEASVTCKSCLKAIAKAEADAYAEFEPIAFTRAESSKIEAMRAAGTLTKGLAAAKARSEARAESDAANDPLVTLLTDTPTVANYTAAATTLATDHGLGGGRIRPKAWVTAHVTAMAEPVAEVSGAVATVAERATAGVEAFTRYRAARQGSSAAPGRLLAASKTGQRRPKRGRR